MSNTVTVPVEASAPVLIAMVHGNGSPVSPEQPGRAGEVLSLYASGLGEVDAPVVNGEAAPGRTLVRMQVAPAVTINAVPAPVLFAGLTPGAVGLYQINFTIPEGATAETGVSAAFRLSVGSSSVVGRIDVQ